MAFYAKHEPAKTPEQIRAILQKRKGDDFNKLLASLSKKYGLKRDDVLGPGPPEAVKHP
jgi:hypothetical protein